MTPFNIPIVIAERAQDFTGRTWVVDQVLDWLDHGTERFFLLTGEPGSGKTALAAWLSGNGPFPQDDEAKTKLERVRSFWSAAHFCVGRTQGDTINPSRFAGALAQQLSDRYVGYATAAVTALDPEYGVHQEVERNWGEVIGIKTNTLIISGRHPQEVYDLAVRRPLETLLAAQPTLRVAMVVDALDEALLFDADYNIVTLLAGSTNLPTGVRFLLTCRSNERRVLDQFEDVRLLNISATKRSDVIDHDIRSYVLARLATPMLQKRVPAEDSKAVANQLANVAEGNFLYVRFILDEVQAGVRNLIDVAGLPRGLYALYRSYLDRIIPDVGTPRFAETWLRSYEPLLGNLSVAIPLSPDQLLPRWLEWDKGEVQARLDTITQVIECMEDGNKEDGSGCSLYHRSMADFLAADFYWEGDARRRNQYYAEPLRQHSRIARYYLRAIKDVWGNDWTRCDQYGLRQLVNHLRTRLVLAERDQQPQLSSELYNIVLDPSFRSAQQQRFASVTAPLPDLRTAMETALARDDLVPALRCIGAYRQTIQSQSVTEVIFRAVDRGDFAEALKTADYYGPAPKPRGRWARVLHCYLAWEAAEQELPGAARKAAAEAETMAPQDWSHALYENLSDALLIKTARRLAGAGSDPVGQLSELIPGSDATGLLVAHPVPAVLGGEQQQMLEVQLSERLGRLEQLAAEGSAEFVSGVLFLDPETIAAETYDLRSLLAALAPYPAGQVGIDRALAANLSNPYPRYRDIALAPIAIASVAVPDTNWSRQRLRTILRTGLDAEGITFTFDLPAILLEEAARRGFAAPDLSAYLTRALNQDDRWGTQIRARSARAAALFWQGETDAAFTNLQEASQVPRTYAGYASLALLLLANRCHEFGISERACQPVWGLNLDVALLDGAAALAEKVYDLDFRAERRQLVQSYLGWLEAPQPTTHELRTRLANIQDPDTRRVYKDLAGARWAAEMSANVEALTELALTMLDDSTTLDATLGRLVGLRIRQHRMGERSFGDVELAEALNICNEQFTTGRPWEFGRWY